MNLAMWVFGFALIFPGILMLLLPWIYSFLGVCPVHNCKMFTAQTDADWKGSSYPTLVCSKCRL